MRRKLFYCALVVLNVLLLQSPQPATAEQGDASAGAYEGTTEYDQPPSLTEPIVRSGVWNETWTGTWVAVDEGEEPIVFTGSVEITIAFAEEGTLLAAQGVFFSHSYSGVTTDAQGCTVTIEGRITEGEFTRVGFSGRDKYEEDYEVHRECEDRRARGTERGVREHDSAFGAGDEPFDLSQGTQVGHWVTGGPELP